MRKPKLYNKADVKLLPNGQSSGGLFEKWQSTCNLPIAGVHINKKVDMLNEAGIRSLSDLLDIFPHKLKNVRGVGHNTVEHVAERLAQIGRSLDDSGGISWETFCALARIPILPISGNPQNGSEFLSILPRLAGEIASFMDDPLERSILLDRLTKPKRLQKTLQELAESQKSSLTRERVRQKEIRLLDDLSDAFLYDEYCNLNLRFSSELTKFWKRAIPALPSRAEISFDEFCERLCICWNVSTNELLEHIPFITVVLTNKPQIPAYLRNTNHRVSSHRRSDQSGSEQAHTIILRGFRRVH